MAAELSTKLREVFGFSENRIEAVMYDLRRMATRVDIRGELHGATIDLDDDMFIKCAMTANAHVIVSGNHHLLELREYAGIRLLSAAEFISHITGR